MNMRKWRVRERSFKRLSFFTTLAGIALMAIGLQQGILLGRWLIAIGLFVVGSLIALVTVIIEPVAEAGFTVTLYTRQECTLCDAARDFLVGKKSEYDFDLWLVDVDEDAEAAAKYSDYVPVAMVGQEELFRLSPDYVRLEARLRALADARLKR